MRISIRSLILVLLVVTFPLAVLASPSSDTSSSSVRIPDQAHLQFMDLDELQRLLNRGPVFGYFVSVPKGTTLQQYRIRIQGIYEVPDLNIVVFSSYSHVVAGMSGSPVYVRGENGKEKLLGAVAYSLSFLNPRVQWGGISPITLMVKEANKANDTLAGNKVADGQMSSFTYRGMTLKPIALGNQTLPNDIIARVSSPFADMLKANKFVIMSHQASASTAKEKEPQKLRIEAGMPIVVELLRWVDGNGKGTSLGAMGTITYVSPEGRVYVFGHPFLGTKEGVYPFRAASVMGTIISDLSSEKLPGVSSQVRGTIRFDGKYGIYGKMGISPVSTLEKISVRFEHAGIETSSYTIRLAKTTMSASLLAYALDALGGLAGAPLPHEKSTTEMAVSMPIDGYQTVSFKELFLSSQMIFGPNEYRFSSYDVACSEFFDRLYSQLHQDTYHFRFHDTSLVFDFLQGTSRNVVLASMKFPTKVRWGSQPTLDVVLVSADNQRTFSLHTPVHIDWDKVEKPIYGPEVRDIDKQGEKIVRGVIAVFSSGKYGQYLTSDERTKEYPSYFLGPKDFLAVFSKSLHRTSRAIFVKVQLQRKSGLDKGLTKDEEQVTNTHAVADDTWHVSENGLEKRMSQSLDHKVFAFLVDVPQIPGSYILDSGMGQNITFEVVK